VHEDRSLIIGWLDPTDLNRLSDNCRQTERDRQTSIREERPFQSFRFAEIAAKQFYLLVAEREWNGLRWMPPASDLNRGPS
jgi:hypothetical protein